MKEMNDLKTILFGILMLIIETIILFYIWNTFIDDKLSILHVWYVVIITEMLKWVSKQIEELVFPSQLKE